MGVGVGGGGDGDNAPTVRQTCSIGRVMYGIHTYTSPHSASGWKREGISVSE